MTIELIILAAIALVFALKLAWNCRLCKVASLTGDANQKNRFCRKALCKS